MLLLRYDEDGKGTIDVKELGAVLRDVFDEDKGGLTDADMQA